MVKVVFLDKNEVGRIFAVFFFPVVEKKKYNFVLKTFLLFSKLNCSGSLIFKHFSYINFEPNRLFSTGLTLVGTCSKNFYCLWLKKNFACGFSDRKTL